MKNNEKSVSIIVPTRNSESTIEECLKSVKEQSYKKFEIIVIDNNSTDNTKKIARRYTKYVYNMGPERSAQRNFGASKAKGEFYLFIDSDMELGKGVVKECVMSIEGYKALVIPEKSFGTSFWAKCKVLERSFYVGVDWMEAARFFSKSIFVKYHGYDEKQTGTEDYDLPQRIKNDFGKKSIGRINEYIMHNEGNLGLIYTLKKKYYYLKTANRYTESVSNKYYFSKQSSILERYKLFFSKPKKLFSNPAIGIGMLFMKTCEYGAAGVGYLNRE